MSMQHTMSCALSLVTVPTVQNPHFTRHRVQFFSCLNKIFTTNHRKYYV